MGPLARCRWPLDRTARRSRRAVQRREHPIRDERCESTRTGFPGTCAGSRVRDHQTSRGDPWWRVRAACRRRRDARRTRAFRHFTQERLGQSMAGPKHAVPVRALSFRSRARASEVQSRIVPAPLKPSSQGVPVSVWLHGRGDRAMTVVDVVDELRLLHYLHSAIARGVPAIRSGRCGRRRPLLACPKQWRRTRIDGCHQRIPDVLEHAGIRASSWAGGWSMGGRWGLAAGRAAHKFVAVAASSLAVWFTQRLAARSVRLGAGLRRAWRSRVVDGASRPMPDRLRALAVS